jgi:hypothetical protein
VVAFCLLLVSCVGYFSTLKMEVKHLTFSEFRSVTTQKNVLSCVRGVTIDGVLIGELDLLTTCTRFPN